MAMLCYPSSPDQDKTGGAALACRDDELDRHCLRQRRQLQTARRGGSCASKVRTSRREAIFRMLTVGEAIPHALFIRAADSPS